MYLSGPTFLANLTPPNKQSLKVKSEFKSLDHVSNWWELKKYYLWKSKSCVVVTVVFLCRFF